MMRFRVTLPWPPKDLSPNRRCHWAKKSKAAKKYRNDCHIIATAAMCAAGLNQGHFSGIDKLHLFIDFVPADRRHRDDDNCYASFKNGRDGIADALGVDDQCFISHPYLVDTETVKGGEIRVRLVRVRADREINL